MAAAAVLAKVVTTGENRSQQPFDDLVFSHHPFLNGGDNRRELGVNHVHWRRVLLN